jgi:hypothetical protein
MSATFEQLTQEVPLLGRTFPDSRTSPWDPRTYIWEHFYFTYVTPEVQTQAVTLAKKISQISRGRKTLLLSENSEVVGKIGEFVVRDFCEQYIQAAPWESMVEQVNEHGGDCCDLRLPGVQIDIKTRQLHTDVTIAPSMELRVPKTELDRYQDIYILAGYCPETQYGYVFGWCSWEELQSKPIRTDIKFPARCVPLTELHHMLHLEQYAQLRSLAKFTNGLKQAQS